MLKKFLQQYLNRSSAFFIEMSSAQETVYNDLEKLNFTVNETKVYVTLIYLGSSLAGKIAKEAQLDRSSTYNALKSLVQRGIVSTVYENKRTVYVPENPKKLLDYYHEKEEIAKQIIPRLHEQFQFKKQKTAVKLFQGYKGIKTIFQDIIDSCKENETYYVLASEGKFSESMPYYAPLFRMKKEEKKIKTKMLIRDGREKKQRGRYTEYRKVPSDVISPATINIYAGKVAILVWETQPKGILIENEAASKSLENYFKLLWKYAKPME